MRRSFSACNGVPRTDAEAAGPNSPSYSDSRESSWASSKRRGEKGACSILPTGFSNQVNPQRAFIMVSIRQATLEDLLSMQDANLHCLPENYQVTTRCETTTPPHRPPRAQDHNPQAMMPTQTALRVHLPYTHTLVSRPRRSRAAACADHARARAVPVVICGPAMSHLRCSASFRAAPWTHHLHLVPLTRCLVAYLFSPLSR